MAGRVSVETTPETTRLPENSMRTTTFVRAALILAATATAAVALRALWAPGWRRVIGRVPSDEEVANAVCCAANAPRKKLTTFRPCSFSRPE